MAKDKKIKFVPKVVPEPGKVTFTQPDTSGAQVLAHIDRATVSNEGPTVAEAALDQIVDQLGAGEIDEARLKELVRKQIAPKLRKQVMKLLENGYASAEAQRAAVRAGRFKTFLTLMESAMQEQPNGDLRIDPDLVKLALQAAKQIASDPDVGLSQAPPAPVNIDIGSLSGILEDLKPEEVIDVKSK